MNNKIPNTFNLAVSAKYLITATTNLQIVHAYQQAKQQNLPFLIIGQGSNTLFTSDFDGYLVLNRIKDYEIMQDDDFWYLKVGAGEVWHDVVKFCIKNNMLGLENLALIPGCIGSAAIQNIGAYGAEFKEFFDYVELLSLQQNEIIKITDGQYGYRDSIFKQKYQHDFAVVNVALKIKKNWQPKLEYGDLQRLKNDSVTAKIIFNEVCKIRQSKLPDPAVYGNAGSFFVNPVISEAEFKKLQQQYLDMPAFPQKNNTIKIAAGWLIDQCGLKGFELGGAAVHENHALVIINKKNAKPHDIVTLASFIKKRVYQKFGIHIYPEIRFIGKKGEVNANTLLNPTNIN